MKKVLLVLFVLSALIINSFGQEQTDLNNKLLSRYAGVWENVDSQTVDLTKVIITNDNNELFINAFGKCNPRDCEWGKVKIFEIAASIEEEKNVLPFDYLLAIWEMDGQIKNAMTIIMKITIKSGPNPKLYIDTITIFNDNSERSNYHDLNIMMKRFESN